MNQALHPHLPSLIVLPEDQQSAPGINNFQFNILLKNTEDISYVFALPFYNVDNATIAGNVEMTGDGKVQIDAHIPRLMFGNNDIRETKINLQSALSSGVGLDVNTYLVQDNGYVNARLESDALP